MSDEADKKGLIQLAEDAIGLERVDAVAADPQNSIEQVEAVIPTGLHLAAEVADYAYGDGSALSVSLTNAVPWLEAELLAQTMMAMCWKWAATSSSMEAYKISGDTNSWCQAGEAVTADDQRWHPLIQGTVGPGADLSFTDTDGMPKKDTTQANRAARALAAW